MLNKELYAFKTEQMLKYRKSFINYLKRDNISNEKIYAILAQLDKVVVKELDIERELNNLKLDNVVSHNV